MLQFFFNRPQVRRALFLLLAVFMGGLVSLDHWIVLVRSPQVWGDYVVPTIDTHRHILFPQARDILDGHFFFADTQLYEYRDGFPMTPWPWLPPVLYAIFWKLFGTALYLPLSTLIIGAASFVILVMIGKEITRRWSLGVIAAVLTLTARLAPLYLFPGNISELKLLGEIFFPGALGVIPERVDFLPYESFNPTWLVLGPALLLLHRALAQKQYRLLPWVGVLGGILIYCYPFHWIWIGAVLGLLLCGAACMRRWDLVRWTLLAIGLNLAFTVPYWINQYLLAQAGILTDINLRNAGFEIGRYIRWSQWQWYLLWSFLGVAVWRVARRRGEQGTAAFLAVLFVALVACLNLQILTNRNIHPDHWITRISFLPVGWSLWYIAAAAIDELARRRWVRPAITIAVLSVVLVGPLIGAWQDRWVTAERRLAHPPFSADVWRAYVWINRHLPKDTVILAPAVDVQSHLTIYTFARSFLSHGLSTFALEPEVLDRWFAAYRLVGVPEKLVEAQLARDFSLLYELAPSIMEADRELRESIYWVRWRSQEFDASLKGYSSGSIPPHVLADLMGQYRSYDVDLASLRQRYRLDYVLSTEFDQMVGTKDLAERADLEEVFRSGEVVLYRVLP